MGPSSPSTEQRPRGRPRVRLDPEPLIRLRGKGWSLRRIARKVGASKDTIRNTLKTLSKKSQVATFPRKAPVTQGPGGGMGGLGHRGWGLKGPTPVGQPRRGPQRPETPTGPANHAGREGFA